MTSTSWPDGDRLADVADLARALGRPVHAVQALGEDPGHRRLADAPGAAEQVGVGHPVQPDRVAEGLDDVVLADDVLEPLRPIAPGDDRVIGLPRRRAAGGDGVGSPAMADRGLGLAELESRCRRTSDRDVASVLDCFSTQVLGPRARSVVPKHVMRRATSRRRPGVGARPSLARRLIAGVGESRGGSPGHMKAMLMAAAFPP